MRRDLRQKAEQVEATLRASAIGDAAMVGEQLQALVEATQADELMVNAMILMEVR